MSGCRRATDLESRRTRSGLRKGLTLSQNARAFALLNLAGANAFIASWDAKFTYNQWSPVTAIRAAHSDDNPNTMTDPGWTPLLVSRHFPITSPVIQLMQARRKRCSAFSVVASIPCSESVKTVDAF